MADEAPKPKKAGQEAGVLGGLPATRPSRMSRRSRAGGTAVEAARAAASRTADTREATGSRASGKRTTAADKTRGTSARKAVAKPEAAAARPKAAAAKPKSAAARPKAKRAAPGRATPEPPAKVAAIREAPKPPRKPRAVREGSPALREPTQKAESRREDAPIPRPTQSGPELVSTVVQAAGELASIGLTVGGQIIKRAASKLPKP